ncbi:response regulator [Candidatus Nomurabacteria bacterium]|nr:response regulator [Candidatus Nomurabacteria bacterium]
MLILLDMDKRILIIEDEPDIREAMAEAITQAGYEALTAENGQVGLEMALAERPDIILLDIIMPIMDGHQMLAKLRIHPWGKSVKVIMLTSMDDVKNIGMAHEGSITDYIIKAHSSLDEIVSKVKMAIYT